MCGILGIFNIKQDKTLEKNDLEKALISMQHRGPDAQDVKIFDNKAGLAHLRLAIIDLKAESNQPFQVDNRYWITYNGEIYNYLELKQQLITEGGYSFRTESDTEVLLRAYQHWGEDCVNKFNGMWAFAIYDALNNTLFCSRDRFGVKPFNYALVDGQFIFASEIKGILSYFPQLKQPNYNVIANYCRTSAGAQHEETWFDTIFRLQPAHNMLITEGGVKKYRYWNYPIKVDKSLSFEAAKIEYADLFLDAVKLRMRSDVPVGTTLSSGVDSNSIVYTLRRPPKDSLQLGIYYLAVQESEALAQFKPVRSVELAFLRGNWKRQDIDFRKMPINPREEEQYQADMRERLAALIQRKKDLNASEVYRPNPYANCRFCDFKSLCPLYPEGQPVFSIESLRRAPEGAVS